MKPLQDRGHEVCSGNVTGIGTSFFGALISPHLALCTGHRATGFNACPSGFQSLECDIFLCHCMLEVFNLLFQFYTRPQQRLARISGDFGLNIYSTVETVNTDGLNAFCATNQICAF